MGRKKQDTTRPRVKHYGDLLDLPDNGFVRLFKRSDEPYFRTPKAFFWTGPEPRRIPLSAEGERLLRDYSLRREFWHHVVEYGNSAAWAGEKLLGLGKSQASVVVAELEALVDRCPKWVDRPDPRFAPLIWFRDRVAEAMARGTIRAGFDTRHSRVADAFYLALWGRDVWDVILTMDEFFTGSKRIDLWPLVQAAQGKGWVEHVIGYMIATNRIFELEWGRP